MLPIVPEGGNARSGCKLDLRIGRAGIHPFLVVECLPLSSGIGEESEVFRAPQRSKK